MFRYYKAAKTCYAFLSDVDNLTEFDKSRWFGRGWTLQELIAPRDVQFYSSSWIVLGSKHQLAELIERATRIPQQVLLTGNLDNVSIATKMSWAADRQTSRREDIAYCLMGIFQIYMPLLYGEGSNAFLRLQQEIIKVSLDPSLFAWGLASNIEKVETMESFSNSKSLLRMQDFAGLFAKSPADFTCANQIVVLEDLPHTTNAILTGNGVSISLPILERESDGGRALFAGLSCMLRGKNEYYLCLALVPWRAGTHARYKKPLLLQAKTLVCASLTSLAQKSVLIKSPKSETPHSPQAPMTFTIVRMPRTKNHWRLEEVHCMSHATYFPESGCLALSEIRNTPHAVFYFKGDVVRFIGNSVTSSNCARIAIIVGGDLSQRDLVWTDCVQGILEDDTAQEEFHALADTAPELLKSCMAKSQLVSLLEKTGKINPDSSGKPWCREKILNVNRSKQPDYLKVDVQPGPCNLLENTMFIYIDISDDYDFEDEYPNWWDYKVFNLTSQITTARNKDH
jgi:hypothetical protein